MKRKSKAIKAFTLCIVVILVFVSSMSLTAYATPDKTQLEKEKQQLEQEIAKQEKELQKLQGNKSKQQEYAAGIDAQKASVKQKMDLINQDISVANAEIAEIDGRINALTADIKVKEKEITQKEKDVDAVYDTLAERLSIIYMNGSASTLELLSGIQDLSTLLSRLEAMKGITDQDNQMVKELVEQVKQLEAKKKALDDKKVEISAERDAEVEKRYKLNQSRASLESEQQALDNLYSETNNLIASLNKDSALYQQKMSEYQSQLNALEDSISNLVGEQGSNSGDGSESNVDEDKEDGNVLFNPVQDPSRYISAPFGTYPGTNIRHRGLDITCNGALGKPLYAAESGVVLIAQYYSDLGYYIVIDHGGGISTGYGHCQSGSFLVSAGQRVSRGQQIARVGNTGNSFGPHVHFVLFRDGIHSNPEPYLEKMPYIF